MILLLYVFTSNRKNNLYILNKINYKKYLLDILNIYLNLDLIIFLKMGIGDWGLGIGDWGLGIGDWGLAPTPNPQSPIPNPQSPFVIIILNILKY